MSRRMRFVTMAFLLLAAPTLAGSGSASAAERIIIATTGKGQPPEWPDFIAISQGFFAENGISVELGRSPVGRGGDHAGCSRVGPDERGRHDRSDAGHRPWRET